MNFEVITEYLKSLVEKEGIPSVDCSIHQDHKEVYRFMAGTCDREKTVPVMKDQIYLMFSMTKVQTMIAIMQLVEQGKVSLEEEVGAYLPAYKNLMVKTSDGDAIPAKEPLKVKYLLSMQSGLNYDLNRPGIRRVIDEKGQKAKTLELVNSFVESPLEFEPGTSFLYSLSHDVAAAIVEVVSGMSFGEYLKNNIWEPLGMKNTFFCKPYNEFERLAQQFIMDETGKIVPMEPTCDYQLTDSYESGGAGLASCTEDYAIFGDAIACGGISADGVRIIKAETIEIIKQNLLCEASLKELRFGMGRVGYGYGCGMQVFMDPEAAGSPAPAGVFGWDGAAGSCITMDTASKTSFVFTMHVRNCGMSYGIVHPKLRDLVFGK